MTKPEVFILGGARTPMTDYVGALKDVSAIDLGAIAARGALERTGVKPGWIDHVVFGNVQQSSVDAHYGARHVGLKAGVPVDVPALTVNRLCGSGIQAAVSGAQMIQLGEAGIVLAGGMENMSQVPHVIRGLRSGLKLGQGKLEDWLWEGAHRSVLPAARWRSPPRTAPPSTASAAQEADEFALRSQQLAAAGVDVRRARGGGRAGRDQDAQGRHAWSSATTTCVRTRRWRCSRRSPAAFKKDGIVTAGNASGIVDGGAALVLASADAAAARGLKPLGRLVSWASVGVEPTLMGMGPVPAIRKALEAAGLSLGDVDLFEINEAFAGAVPGVREGARARSRARQRERRRDRARPSARRERRAPAADAAARAQAPRPQARRGVRLHRRRAGHRGGGRGALVTCDERHETSYMQIKTVGVLGCGLMGSGIAQVCAASGYKTIVREVNDALLDKGLGRIRKFLDDGVAKGKVTAEARDTTLGNLSGDDERSTR